MCERVDLACEQVKGNKNTHAERDSRGTERWRMNSPERELLGSALATKMIQILNKQKVFHGVCGFVDILKQCCIKEMT